MLAGFTLDGCTTLEADPIPTGFIAATLGLGTGIGLTGPGQRIAVLPLVTPQDNAALLFAPAVGLIAYQSRRTDHTAAGEGTLVVSADTAAVLIVIRCAQNLSIPFDGLRCALLGIAERSDTETSPIIQCERSLATRTENAELGAFTTR